MDLYFVSIGMTVVANVAYHLCMKHTNPAVHPVASLAVSYFMAMLSCIVLLPLLRVPIFQEVKNLNWASPMLGVSIVMLEVGFILAYRAGWNISQAAVYANIAVGIILFPIGLFFFKEQVSLTNVIGLISAMLGLYLLGNR